MGRSTIGEGEGEEESLPVYDKHGSPPGYDLDLEAGLGLEFGSGDADAATTTSNAVTSESSSSHGPYPIPTEDAPAYSEDDNTASGMRDGEVADSSISPQPGRVPPPGPIPGTETV